ncbi:sugar ABC transporter permease [Streptomyces bomunensis]|uniref:Sugar ABC transporter permease n=2 Tax=Streptomyces montanisoli TaxID=2798581 RepID=A0A940RZJ5_9ACTN|nr:sugar ABC transporter permease [Streptomyces montanisoli]
MTAPGPGATSAATGADSGSGSGSGSGGTRRRALRGDRSRGGAGRGAGGPARRSAAARGTARPGIGWALPAVVFFGLFALVPLVMVAVLSFTSWSGLGSPSFAGLTNWTKLFHDPVMIQSLWLSVLLTGLGVVVQTPLSILIGVWAAGPQRGRAVLAAVFFVPLLLSVTAVSVLWRALLDPNFGVPAQARWLFGDGDLFGSRTGAIGVLVLVSAWQYTPLHSLIYQGATRAIPKVLYQAAAVDGAGRVRQFFHITLPQLRNAIVTSVILMVVGGLTTFDSVLILTQGGPGTDTTITAFYMYEKAFKSFDYGAGAAIALLLVVVATAISLVVVRLSGYDRMAGTQEGLS